MNKLHNKYSSVPPVLEKKKHRYIKEIEYTSVTQFVKSFFTPFDDKNISKFVAKARQNKGEKITAAQVRKEWKNIALNGTNVHTEIEKYILDGEFPHSQAATDAVSFLLSRKFKSMSPEMVLFSDELLLAGTTDLVALDNDHNTWIVDWKTNTQIRESSKNKGTGPCSHIDDCNMWIYFLQLNTYKYLYEKQFGDSVFHMCFVHLKPTGGYVVYDVPDMTETVSKMISYWEDR